jgi:hypothetical protein
VIDAVAGGRLEPGAKLTASARVERLRPISAALLGAALLYRNLERRFERMEAALRSKTMDRWFVEIRAPTQVACARLWLEEN